MRLNTDYGKKLRNAKTVIQCPPIRQPNGDYAKSNQEKADLFSDHLKEISKPNVSLGVEDGVLQAYNSDFELQFSHKVQNMSRFSQADIDPCTFLYLLRDDAEQLLYCYLFQALKAADLGTRLVNQVGTSTLTNLIVIYDVSSDVAHALGEESTDTNNAPLTVAEEYQIG
ncbi:hypothetical protein ILUMI_12316 [Ignelater luminosus]|uniref:Uncharacterized protein n=1 Tax=Ignelater luminosus TaxID=2038154 RepID=A0A8K0CZT1_IGNLU|nr:hypothetical protein ILUMI_12316 [Ignelater luminosus]